MKMTNYNIRRFANILTHQRKRMGENEVSYQVDKDEEHCAEMLRNYKWTSKTVKPKVEKSFSWIWSCSLILDSLSKHCCINEMFSTIRDIITMCHSISPNLIWWLRNITNIPFKCESVAGWRRQEHKSKAASVRYCGNEHVLPQLLINNHTHSATWSACVNVGSCQSSCVFFLRLFPHFRCSYQQFIVIRLERLSRGSSPHFSWGW